uniref:Amino acid transporter transmembrane domain-containing protein n=1 Tax=Heterosigma akashiwo TaxID=2829 RepID=A0A7S4D5B8_HETAK|mmetsp:Transcript_17054/g.28027  ORF Transcript_17054/g.28027 Transcript_17054/m.28027 type:complete len:522 (+) Transcript_17054:38-1603(+)
MAHQQPPASPDQATPWEYHARKDKFYSRDKRYPHLRPSPSPSPVISNPRNKSTAKGRGHLPSVEFIYPAPVSSGRQSGLAPAVFNLCATILGGGVLSLPYTFAQLGWGLGLVTLIAVALVSDFALYILCSCARRSGMPSYVEVAKHAFGKKGGQLITIMLAVFILFVVVAYQVLIRDIASGIVEFFLGYDLDMDGRNKVLYVCVLMIAPLCFFKSLHALRYTCYLGFAAVCLLVGSLVYLGWAFNRAEPSLWATYARPAEASVADFFYVLPILAVSYVCQFNMLSVHSQLKHPTRGRMKTTIHLAIGLATLIYAVGAMAGYSCAYMDTNENIFNNFEPSNKLLLVGRCGLFVTLLCNTPMMVLPCRESALLLVDDAAAALRALCCCCGPRLEKTQLLGQESQDYSAEAADSFDDGSQRQLGEGGDGGCGGAVRHVAFTVLILGLALYLAVCIPGVAVVWSIAGSTMGLVLAFVLPAACYLKIRWQKKNNLVKKGAMVLLIGSIAFTVFCSYQSIGHALSEN